MLNQSFNIEALNTIFMLATRRGQVKKEYLSEEYLDIAQEHHQTKAALLKLKRLPKSQKTDEKKDEIKLLRDTLITLANKQELALQKHFQKILKEINTPSFKFTLTPNSHDEKTVYEIGNSAKEFFAMQMLCRNLKRTFKLEFSSRDCIISQLKQLLTEDRHRKFIIRTDIKNCYESIPHRELFNYVDDNTLLNYQNKSLLKGLILHEFEEVNTRAIAKLQINDLIQSFFKQKIWEHPDVSSKNDDSIEDVDDFNNQEYDVIPIAKHEVVDKYLASKISLFSNPNTTIAQIKAIISASNTQYTEIANYILEIFGRKVDRFINKFNIGFRVLKRSALADDYKKEDCVKQYERAQKQMFHFLINCIDIAFFIYNSNRQVNTTLKLQKMLNTLILYIGGHYKIDGQNHSRFSPEIKDGILKKIQDELSLVMTTTTHLQNSSIHETLYLLVLSKSLGTKYMFSEHILEKYLNSENIKNNHNRFYFQILLYYYGNTLRYKNLKDKLIDELMDYYEHTAEKIRNQSAELSILTADLMCCPYINKNTKKNLLEKMGINDETIKDTIINFAKRQKYIFTKWSHFDLNKELQAKISQEVYS